MAPPLRLLVVACHWVGCLWLLCGRASRNSLALDDWIRADEASSDFSIDHGDLGGTCGYLRAVYFAMVAMSTVGYGDIVPTNALETAFTTAVILFGGLLVPAIVGALASMMANLNAALREYRARMVALRRVMRRQALPAALRASIVRYHDHLWSRQGEVNELEILDELPKPLRQSVVWAIVGDNFESVTFLKRLSPDAQHAIAAKLEPRTFVPGDQALSAGEHTQALYLIEVGAVEVTTADRVLSLECKHEGDFFGESCLVQGATNLTCVFALTYVDCFAIAKADFKGALASFPDDLAKVLKAVNEEWQLKLERIASIARALALDQATARELAAHAAARRASGEAAAALDQATARELTGRGGPSPRARRLKRNDSVSALQDMWGVGSPGQQGGGGGGRGGASPKRRMWGVGSPGQQGGGGGGRGGASPKRRKRESASSASSVSALRDMWGVPGDPAPGGGSGGARAMKRKESVKALQDMWGVGDAAASGGGTTGGGGSSDSVSDEKEEETSVRNNAVAERKEGTERATPSRKGPASRLKIPLSRLKLPPLKSAPARPTGGGATAPPPPVAPNDAPAGANERAVAAVAAEEEETPDDDDDALVGRRCCFDCQDPDAPARQGWAALVLGVCVYNAFVVPWRVAWTPPLRSYALDWALDALLVVDVLLCATCFGFVRDGRLEADRAAIFARYRETHLKADLLCSMPFDLLALASRTPSSRRLVLALARAPKVLRLARLESLAYTLTPLLERVRVAVGATPVTMLRLLATVLFVSHVFACVWFGCGRYRHHLDAWDCASRGQTRVAISGDETAGGGDDDGDDAGEAPTISARSECLFHHTWVEAQVRDGYLPTDAWLSTAAASEYVRALNWALPTLVVVVIGDVVPVSCGETLFVFLAILFGMSVNAVIIGAIASLVANLESEAADFLARDDALKAYLHAHALPAALRERVEDFMAQLCRANRAGARHSLAAMESLPRTLRMAVAESTAQVAVIKACPFFDFCDDEVRRPTVFRRLPATNAQL